MAKTKKKIKKSVKRIKKSRSKKLSPIEKRDNQLKMIVIFMAGLIIVVLLSYWLSIETKKFSYVGLDFEKRQQGSLVLYFTEFPISDIFGNIVGYQGFYLRQDPRKIDYVELPDSINLKKDTALAADGAFIGSCEDSIVAGTTLSVFLQKSGINPIPATTNQSEADKYGRLYVDCGDTSQYSIIQFKLGDESKVSVNGDCYTILTSICDVMNVTERFMIGLYANSRGIELD